MGFDNLHQKRIQKHETGWHVRVKLHLIRDLDSYKLQQQDWSTDPKVGTVQRHLYRACESL